MTSLRPFLPADPFLHTKASDYEEEAAKFADQCFQFQPELKFPKSHANLFNDSVLDVKTESTCEMNAKSEGELQANDNNSDAKAGTKGQKKPRNNLKRERNKMAAANYRKRRKAYVEGLEGKIKVIEAEKESQQKTIDNLQASNQLLYHQNVSLLQQVSFLKSMLCMNGNASPSCVKFAKKSAIGASLGLIVTVLTLSIAVFHPTAQTNSFHTQQVSPETPHLQQLEGNSLTTVQENSLASVREDSPLGTLEKESPLGDTIHRSLKKENIEGIPYMDSAADTAPAQTFEKSTDTEDISVEDSKAENPKLERVKSLMIGIFKEDKTEILEKLEDEALDLLEIRASIILNVQKNRKNDTIPPVKIHELLNLHDRDFCAKVGCSTKTLRRLKFHRQN